MTRQEWLEKFIKLADSGAKTTEFRRHCRIKAQHLPRHIKSLDAYRAELALLEAEGEIAKRIEEAKRAREERTEKRRKALEAKARGEADTKGGSEALGARGDNSTDA